MQRNKYLDALGIDVENYGSNFIRERKIQRFLERRKYGFDFRQTVNMDLMFAEWLYSRLMMLKEQTTDDLSFNSVEFEGQKYTVEQAIDRILKASKSYLFYYEETDMNGVDISEEAAQEIREEMKTAARLWSEIMVYADRVVCKDLQKK